MKTDDRFGLPASHRQYTSFLLITSHQGDRVIGKLGWKMADKWLLERKMCVKKILYYSRKTECQNINCEPYQPAGKRFKSFNLSFYLNKLCAFGFKSGLMFVKLSI